MPRLANFSLSGATSDPRPSPAELIILVLRYLAETFRSDFLGQKLDSETASTMGHSQKMASDRRTVKTLT